MLNYCDIYPIQLPSRYSNKVACYETVYIVSNWDLEKQYPDCKKNDKESYDAFLRRIHEVRVYNADGTIDTYNSVKEYMYRNTPLKEITKCEQQKLPFTN